MEPLGKNIWRMDRVTIVEGECVDGRLRARQIAGLGSRALAGIADMALQAMLLMVVAAATPKILPVSMTIGWIWTAAAAAMALHILYHLATEMLMHGTSPGKSLVGLQIADLSTGAQPGAYAILMRNLLRVVDWLPFLYGCGILLGSKSELRQRLGDRAASTLVVYREPLSVQLERAGVSESLYSTSDDGYFLEAVVARYAWLEPGAAMGLAKAAAEYFHKRYPPDRQEIERLYAEGRFREYLERRLEVERKIAAA